jgi:amino acid transporter
MPAETVELKRELGLSDLVLTQILFIVGLAWVGVAAKLGPSHVVFWLLAMTLFYVPSALVVIYLNGLMPLEGGLYQWAKLGFNPFIGFLVAWNLGLFAILNVSEIGIQVTQYLGHALSGSGAQLMQTPWFIVISSVVVLGALVWLSIRGLSIGKWVHKTGGVLMLVVFVAILALPLLHLAKGAISEFHPLATVTPVVSLMSLNLLGKMGFGAFGGFEYVAIHAGETRSPSRTIGRSVMIAAPIIVLLFIFGTSSVLALVPGEQIDLIAPIPQVLSLGFAPFGTAAGVATLAILALVVIRLAQSSVTFAAITRLPMVAGWDGLLPAWFTRLHPKHQTPANAIVFVGLVTLAFAMVGMVGVGKQEAFQLLWNAAGIFYALTYLVMFAIPLVGLKGHPRAPLWLRAAALSGFLMTLLYVLLSVLPIVEVESRLLFGAKISLVIVLANVLGALIYRRARSLARFESSG